MYLGNQPALSYTSFAKQDFTTSATTSYTLDNPVANENEIALFINFVRQEPTTAYTASGTSLTLTSATSASDDMYCVFLGKAVQTVNPPNGSVGTAQLADSSVSLAKLSATGTKDSTTFLRGDNTFAVAGGTNTPSFFVYRSTSSQTLSDDTYTKVQFNSEVFDTDNTFDNTTNYRFTPGVSGKYFLSAVVGVTMDTQRTGINAQISIYKNGSGLVRTDPFNFYNASETGKSSAQGFLINAIVESNTTDYFEVWVRSNTYSGNSTINYDNSATNMRTYFHGYKIIE